MAGKPKPKTKLRPKTKYDNKAQSERFIEAAQNLGIEETGDTFDRAFNKVVQGNAIRQPDIDSTKKNAKP